MLTWRGEEEGRRDIIIRIPAAIFEMIPLIFWVTGILLRAQVMRSPEIVYDVSLSAAVEAADLILCGVDLER